MAPLAPDIISFMSHFAPLFSSRVWPQAQVLLTGALLAPGRRTVSAILRVMGLDQQPDFQTYHRVLNRCVWSSLQGSQILLRLLIDRLVPQGRLVLVWTILSNVVGAIIWPPRASIAIRSALTIVISSRPVGYAGCR